jgi:hypothetical protein
MKKWMKNFTLKIFISARISPEDEKESMIDISLIHQKIQREKLYNPQSKAYFGCVIFVFKKEIL